MKTATIITITALLLALAACSDTPDIAARREAIETGHTVESIASPRTGAVLVRLGTPVSKITDDEAAESVNDYLVESCEIRVRVDPSCSGTLNPVNGLPFAKVVCHYLVNDKRYTVEESAPDCKMPVVTSIWKGEYR
jgi:hypothetical protein